MTIRNFFTRSSWLNGTRLNLELKLRPATEADLPKLEWMGTYTHFRRMFQNTYLEQQRGNRVMLLAEANHFPIGQIFILVKDAFFLQRGYLYALRVMEPFRGLGIGTRLIVEAERILAQHHLHTASIAVAKDNPGARRLYERLGYEIVSEDDGDWSYEDHNGQTIYVHEPSWMLEKNLQRPG